VVKKCELRTLFLVEGERMAKETEEKIEQRNIEAELKAKVIIGFFIFASVITIAVLAGILMDKYYENIQNPEIQQFMIMNALAKSGGGANFEMDCNFDDVEAYLIGYFEKTKLPAVYDKYGSRVYGTNSNESLEYRNYTLTNYIPERFDLKGLKGIHCSIKGGVLPAQKVN
jgi:hypothetical protein